MLRTQPALLVLITLVGGLSAAPAADVATSKATAPNVAAPKVAVGSQVGSLKFKDIRFLPRTLADFKGKQAFVIVCVNTTCPVVQQSMPKIKRLEAEYGPKGVQFLSLNVSQANSILDIAEHSLTFDLPFPAVKDIEGSTVAALGVTRTPEVAIVDAKSVLRYRGRIDNQYRLGGASPAATEENLKSALDDLLAGREIAVKETPVDGCLISPWHAPPARSDLTYADHIRPLVQKHCAACHRPGAEAPFPLLTYADVSAHGSMIAEVVDDERMPPWYGGRAHSGEFVNVRGLTPAERLIVRQWVDAGMSPGKLDSEQEKSRTQPVKETWTIGQPDRIIKAPEHDIPSEGFVAYKYVPLAAPFLNDTWVQAVQILPDNPRVVHHCNLISINPILGKKSGRFVTGKVPGAPPMSLAGTGVAVRIPQGSVLLLQIHYVTTGKPERCQISLGLKHYEGVVKREMRSVLVDDYQFAIPPGDPHYRVVKSKTLPADVEGYGLFTHMHVRGKDMTFRARHPDGKLEELLTVPNYSFDWQIGYEWNRERFPKGTKLEVVAHYDNSPFNPFNPDPTKTVKEGDQTVDEMFNGFMFYTHAEENLNLQVDPKTGAGKAVQVSAK